MEPASGPVLARRTVVVGVDGTDLSFDALRRSATVAALTHERLVVVFVRHVPSLASVPASGGAAVLAQETLDELETRVADDCAEVLSGTGADWRFDVREGDPAHEILELARDEGASWIVVGASIHGPISSIVLSSVAAHLLHHSDISVAVVRPDRATGV